MNKKIKRMQSIKYNNLNAVAFLSSLLIVISFLFLFFVNKNVNAYYDCSQYGLFAYSDGLGYCKCMSGYVWSTDIFGNKTCVLGSQYCHDKYGYNSRYNSLIDECECRSGYELTKEKYGSGLECVSCFSKYGLYSSYNYLNKKCECDNGYTLNNDNECVKKQNNVYFILKELDTDDRKAIIKSENGYQNYLITYGYECYSFSIKKYLKDKIVVNLGTDFDIDKWDKIVLFNDNEVCDIKSVEKVSSNFSLKPEENAYIPYSILIAKNVDDTISEGALIRAIGDIDVYIVKYVGVKKFKRLVLSPSVFNNYGHLRWEDVMDIEQSAVNSFTTSDLVRAVNDNNVYWLYAQGDTGGKRLIKSHSVFAKYGLDTDGIYEINEFDRDSYITETDLE